MTIHLVHRLFKATSVDLISKTMAPALIELVVDSDPKLSYSSIVCALSTISKLVYVKIITSYGD